MMSFYTKRSHVAHHAYTPRCKGCAALRLQQKHHKAHRYLSPMQTDILNTHPEVKLCMERVEESRDSKLACYMEKQDKAQEPRGDAMGGASPQ